MWVDQRVIQLMADGVHQREEPGIRKLLTEREQQVLRGIFEGLSNKEIAAQLGVSEGAVKATLQQLFQKTRVRTRSQLVRIALEASLATTKTVAGISPHPPVTAQPTACSTPWPPVCGSTPPSTRADDRVPYHFRIGPGQFLVGAQALADYGFLIVVPSDQFGAVVVA